MGDVDQLVVDFFGGKPYTPEMRAVILVAETMARHVPKRRFRRRASPIGFVPIAREVVATLFLLPEGQALVAEIVASPTDGQNEDFIRLHDCGRFHRASESCPGHIDGSGD